MAERSGQPYLTNVSHVCVYYIICQRLAFVRLRLSLRLSTEYCSGLTACAADPSMIHSYMYIYIYIYMYIYIYIYIYTYFQGYSMSTPTCITSGMGGGIVRS